MVHGYGMYRKLKRWRALLALAGLSSVGMLGLLQSEMASDLYFLQWGGDSVMCHYEQGGVLPVVDSGFSPPPRSIFFHETSCRGQLDVRQACAVESAARAHPRWLVHVLFSAATNASALQHPTLTLLQRLSNTRMHRVHVMQYAKGTPLEELVASGALNRTRWVTPTSDVLRFLTLYKWPGVYLDLDVVVARGLGALARSWAARESSEVVAAGVLAFANDKSGRDIAQAAIREIKSRHRGDIWGHNGPGVITKVLQNYCETKMLDAMSAPTCHGFEVYGSQFFYPLTWDEAHRYFRSGDMHLPYAFMYHIWNKVTDQYKVTKDCPYARLARKYCPMIYSHYRKEFGGWSHNLE